MPRSTSRGRRDNRLARRLFSSQVKAVCKECGRPFGWISDSNVPYKPSGGCWDLQLRRTEDGEDYCRYRLRCPCGATPVYTDATLWPKHDDAKVAGRGTVAL
jgi:hypothetical protein